MSVNYNDPRSYKKCHKKQYIAHVCMPPKGTIIVNKMQFPDTVKHFGKDYFTADELEKMQVQNPQKFEEIKFYLNQRGLNIVTEQNPFVVAGTLGELSVLPAAILASQYRWASDDTQINQQSLNKKLQNGVLDWTAVKSISDNTSLWACFIPVKEKAQIETSFGFEGVNVTGIKHGLGDFIVTSDNYGKPNLQYRHVVNGNIFATTYNNQGWTSYINCDVPEITNIGMLPKLVSNNINEIDSIISNFINSFNKTVDTYLKVHTLFSSFSHQIESVKNIKVSELPDEIRFKTNIEQIIGSIVKVNFNYSINCLGKLYNKVIALYIFKQNDRTGGKDALLSVFYPNLRRLFTGSKTILDEFYSFVNELDVKSFSISLSDSIALSIYNELLGSLDASTIVHLLDKLKLLGRLTIPKDDGIILQGSRVSTNDFTMSTTDYNFCGNMILQNSDKTYTTGFFGEYTGYRFFTEKVAHFNNLPFVYKLEIKQGNLSESGLFKFSYTKLSQHGINILALISYSNTLDYCSNLERKFGAGIDYIDAKVLLKYFKLGFSDEGAGETYVRHYYLMEYFTEYGIDHIDSRILTKEEKKSERRGKVSESVMFSYKVFISWLLQSTEYKDNNESYCETVADYFGDDNLNYNLGSLLLKYDDLSDSAIKDIGSYQYVLLSPLFCYYVNKHLKKINAFISSHKVKDARMDFRDGWNRFIINMLDGSSLVLSSTYSNELFWGYADSDGKIGNKKSVKLSDNELIQLSKDYNETDTKISESNNSLNVLPLHNTVAIKLFNILDSFFEPRPVSFNECEEAFKHITNSLKQHAYNSGLQVFSESYKKEGQSYHIHISGDNDDSLRLIIKFINKGNNAGILAKGKSNHKELDTEYSLRVTDYYLTADEIFTDACKTLGLSPLRKFLQSKFFCDNWYPITKNGRLIKNFTGDGKNYCSFGLHYCSREHENDFLQCSCQLQIVDDNHLLLTCDGNEQFNIEVNNPMNLQEVFVPISQFTDEVINKKFTK